MTYKEFRVDQYSELKAEISEQEDFSWWRQLNSAYPIWARTHFSTAMFGEDIVEKVEAIALIPRNSDQPEKENSVMIAHMFISPYHAYFCALNNTESTAEAREDASMIYTANDKKWAEWIAQKIEERNSDVSLKGWDWEKLAGITILSDEDFTSCLCQKIEWMEEDETQERCELKGPSVEDVPPPQNLESIFDEDAWPYCDYRWVKYKGQVGYAIPTSELWLDEFFEINTIKNIMKSYVQEGLVDNAYFFGTEQREAEAWNLCELYIKKKERDRCQKIVDIVGFGVVATDFNDKAVETDIPTIFVPANLATTDNIQRLLLACESIPQTTDLMLQGRENL